MENQSTSTKKELIFTIVCLLVASLFFVWPHEHTKEHHQEEVKLKIGEKTYTTEVSVTKEAREKGLSGRAELCRGCAMLFVFDAPSQYGFWMKDMQFPIDILWLRDGRIVHKESNVSPDDQRILKPTEAADSVLEISPDESVQVGERVDFIE
jgi:uncharacterized membrane protein (UPF0127 family)